MTHKTVIDEIQARHELAVENWNSWDNDPRQTHLDRATLLAILAEALPDKWSPKISGRGVDHKTHTVTKRRVLTPGQCARELKTVLNRTNQQGGD